MAWHEIFMSKPCTRIRRRVTFAHICYYCAEGEMASSFSCSFKCFSATTANIMRIPSSINICKRLKYVAFLKAFSAFHDFPDVVRKNLIILKNCLIWNGISQNITTLNLSLNKEICCVIPSKAHQLFFIHLFYCHCDGYLSPKKFL